MTSANTLAYTAGAASAVLFALFWKGKLPESIAKPIGRNTGVSYSLLLSRTVTLSFRPERLPELRGPSMRRAWLPLGAPLTHNKFFHFLRQVDLAAPAAIYIFHPDLRTKLVG